MFGLRRERPRGFVEPPRAVRATVLRINEDGTATAKPLDFERRHTWQPVTVPRREVKRLGILPGELLEFEIDDRDAITRIRKVFNR
jgi:hypothetical protein